MKWIEKEIEDYIKSLNIFIDKEHILHCAKESEFIFYDRETCDRINVNYNEMSLFDRHLIYKLIINGDL